MRLKLGTDYYSFPFALIIFSLLYLNKSPRFAGLVRAEVGSKVLQDRPDAVAVHDDSVDGVVERQHVKDVFASDIAFGEIRPLFPIISD